MKILCVLSRYAYGKPERGENYDYVHFVPGFERLGHEVEFFDSGDRSLYRDFADLNVALVQRVSALKPDVIFCVLMHYEIWLETLDLIRANSPAVVINWGTDDSWKFAQASRFFSEHVDLHVTTDAVAAAAAASRGLSNVLLSQWAASSTSFSDPCPSRSCRYDVSFVGNLYGYRAGWIEALRAGGIRVACFGHGTENGVVDASRIPDIYRTSRISLNFSGAGQGRGDHRQIKARTFEVPGAGGFLLTEAAPGLERYFEPGKEIETFDSLDQLVAKARYHLDHPDQRDAIAQAGHRRATSDHSYEQRFSEILRTLEPLRLARQGRPWTFSAQALSRAVDQYRRKGASGWLRPVLVAPLSVVFGRERGSRAARRSLYELSWRLAGDATYCARGLPGRLFYAES
jgi:spore maturation protein CgeB